jgi:hypothetical protein
MDFWRAPEWIGLGDLTNERLGLREISSGAGVRQRDFHLQNRQNPVRCQRTTVSGLTMTSTSAQRDHRVLFTPLIGAPSRFQETTLLVSHLGPSRDSACPVETSPPCLATVGMSPAATEGRVATTMSQAMTAPISQVPVALAVKIGVGKSWAQATESQE